MRPGRTPARPAADDPGGGLRVAALNCGQLGEEGVAYLAICIAR
jgi:hypothetical protein